MSEDNLAPKRLPDEDLITYAGCWVAIADGSVAGVGDTAVAAERLGRQKYVREKLHIVFIEPPEGKPLEKPQLLMHLMDFFKQHDQPVYLVGGTVRDMLLDRECKDFDFAVPDRAIKLAYKVADHLKVPAFALNRERDTGRVIMREEGITLDFAGYRGDDIQADLRARDFTVNAMALPVAAETDSALLDPCEGITDLYGRVIRRTHPNSISDDPIRAMRALRLAMYLSFNIEPSTSEAIKRAGPLLDNVSNERIRDELVWLLNGDDPEESMRMLHDHELLSYVLPEIAALQELEQTAPHHETALNHTFSVLSALRLVESAIFEQETQTLSQNYSIRVVLGK
jgi:tRNA nucleotidyltransferase/poly(A) polymerase